MTTRLTAPSAVLALAVILAGSAGAADAACDPAQTKQADHAFQIATGFLQNRNWEQAIPKLQAAIALCPEHDNALRWLGKSYMATDQYEKALEQFTTLVEVKGRNTTASEYMDLGKTHAKLKQYPAARLAYRRAYRSDGTNCNILFNYGMMNYAVKDYAGAVEILGEAADNCPDIRDRVLERLAKAAEKAAAKEERLGNVDQAERFRALHDQYAGDAGGSVGYAMIAKRMNAKDYTGAVAAGHEFLANSPDDVRVPRVHLNMARSQMQIGQVSGAVESYKGYLRAHPNDGEVAGEMIEKLAAAERCDQALAEAEAAMARLGSDVNVRYAYGKALECAGRYKDAKAEFRFVANNSSGDIQSWAREEMRRQEQLEEIRLLKRQNAGR